MEDFYSFDLHEDLVEGIDSMGYRNPTPIQQQAIPLITAGRDLIASAQTGTGKTAAYLIPIIDRISHAPLGGTSTLVLVPTRELAKQIDEQCEGFGYFASISSLPIYGGGKSEGWENQKRALTKGADIIIATPGRLLAHMQLGYVDFSELECLVLDEADKMLDMGFSDDIMQIVQQLPKKRQTLLFSATMPEKIRQFSQQILNNPAEIRLAVSKPAAGIDQRFYMVYDVLKLPLLQHLITELDVQSMILFTSRKSNVNPIVRSLSKMGYEVRGITSDYAQEEREVVLREFKNKQFQILVATDVMSRGIDIDSLSHVVNFDLPREPEDYVHRIGRTARAAGTGKGMALTFVSDHDQDAVVKIERLIERQVEKLLTPPEIGASPEFDPKKYRGKPRNAGPGIVFGAGGGGSRSGSRDGGRDGGRDRNRDGNRDRNQDRDRPRGNQPPRDARPAPAPLADPEALLGAGAEVTLPPTPAPGGEAARKKKRKKKRKPSSGAPNANAPATSTTENAAPAPATESGEPATTGAETAPRRSSRGGRTRPKPDAASAEDTPAAE